MVQSLIAQLSDSSSRIQQLEESVLYWQLEHDLLEQEMEALWQKHIRAGLPDRSPYYEERAKLLEQRDKAFFCIKLSRLQVDQERDRCSLILCQLQKLGALGEVV